MIRQSSPQVFQNIKNFAHGWQADIANFLYGRPAKKIFTIGITGTDGKTTTASLLFHILRTAQLSPAIITTVGARIGEESFDTGLHTTTPSAFILQRYIKKAVRYKSKYLVLEATSHALDQNRVKGIAFRIGVLTNITHDHLDYHKTPEQYIRAKVKLLNRSEEAILNADDESFEKVKLACTAKKIYTYSLKKEADFNLKNIGIKLPEGYEFNFENFLAAISVAKILKINDDQIALALATFKFPTGRQEIVYEEDFKIVIDFAHTPNSFNRVLPALKKTTEGRLIHVFGSAGQRDSSKRPLMGKISSDQADVIILTAEDPRSEKIEDINAQIKLGIKDFKGELFEIPDRKAAITKAIQIAKKGDTVVITGKGHEKSINLGKGEKPWSDHEAVSQALNSAKSST